MELELFGKESLQKYNTSFKSRLKEEMTEPEYQWLGGAIYSNKNYYLTDANKIMLNNIEYGGTLLGTYATLNNNQTIGGEKVFNNTLKLPNFMYTDDEWDSYNITIPDKAGVAAIEDDILPPITDYLETVSVSDNDLTLNFGDGSTKLYSPSPKGIMNYKGDTSWSSLPTTGNEKGDFYNLTDQVGYSATWNGSAWEKSTATINVDGSVSSSSTNALQNKAFTNYVNNYHNGNKINADGSLTITGTIPSNVNGILRRNVTDSWLEIYGGTNGGNGAYAAFTGKDFGGSGAGGWSALRACNGSQLTELLVSVNDCTWAGQTLSRETPATFTCEVSDTNYNAPSNIKCYKIKDNIYYLSFDTSRHSGELKVDNANWAFKNLKINGRPLATRQILYATTITCEMLRCFYETDNTFRISSSNTNVSQGSGMYFAGIVVTE